MIQVKQLRKSISGQEILKGVDLEIRTGEILVVIGRSGGGKSVLLKHLLGLMLPDAGEVWYDGTNLTELDEPELLPLRREMGMVFQNGALFDSMTVGENIAFPLVEREHLTQAELQCRVDRALELVGLAGHGDKMPSDLSGGMRKRAALARAAIGKPKIMFYDEPTAGLDPILSDSISKLISRLSRDLSMTAIVVTHDMASACQIADRIAMLHEGKIYALVTPAELQASTDPVLHDFLHGISKGDIL
ncbi:phospholipid/cholesterol/gamma-HCH transport system ATP-binding protein [Verrucomicrobium sp. GAS474]|uniref:ABC transporter ATP-binding protein n=1 Tax=Verrucomicrobium sp. GAS474 TaxID=1882831 RepID=UPI00087BAA73|nr:ATP-binding cassette domain-containing protein [Verrucomicrobium sp. GAS474]SDU04753.1 phospholipid/cholesterol/gamma-HCH transport system ATP-binding protein [Verrucomicrobium sp. GAS474]